MAGQASIENGKLGGRPPGRRNTKTIAREAAAQQYQQLVLQRLLPVFEHQYSLVKGTAHLFRIEEKANGAKEHVLVQNPDEIGDVLSQMDSWEGQVVNDQYYYITVKAPESRAIDSMLDRAIGKAAQKVDLTGKLELQGVTVSVRRK
jgi:hypothetical protein